MRHALVTGASTGIGRASAVALKEAGFEVWAGVRRDADAAEVEADGLHPLTLDVTDLRSVEDAAEMVLAKTDNKLEALVNNAGIAVSGPVETLTDEDLFRQFDVNVFGLHRVTRTFLPAIIAARGRIVNMGSISGRVGIPLLSPYSSSKHALEGYNDSLRREVRHLGVKVSIIEPGQVATPIWDKSTPSDDELAALPERYRHLGEGAIRMAQAGNTDGIDPAEVAAVVVHAATSPVARARYALPFRERILTRATGIVPESIFDRLVDFSIRRG